MQYTQEKESILQSEQSQINNLRVELENLQQENQNLNQAMNELNQKLETQTNQSNATIQVVPCFRYNFIYFSSFHRISLKKIKK